MKFQVTVNDVRELVGSAGVTTGLLAQRMGLSDSMVSLKLKGLRPIFADEVGAIVGAINAVARMKVTEDQVIRVIGKNNLKVRGFVG